MKWRLLHVAPWIALAAMVVWAMGAPVVVFMSAGEWRIEGDVVSARVSGRKLRDCERIKASEVGYVRYGNVWHEAAFWYVDDETPSNSRPAGAQDFGRWAWRIDPENRPSEVMITIVHRCNERRVQTEIGPFTIQ